MGEKEFNSALHSIINSCEKGNYIYAKKQVEAKLFGKLTDDQHAGIESLLDLICVASKIQRACKNKEEARDLIQDNIEYYGVDFEALKPEMGM